MSALKTIARRTFLIGSAAIAGGVAFGAYAYKRDPENPLLAGLADGEAAITPYVRIDADGITLITPRADSGQGVYSVQAAMIAEELDVELAQVRVDPGPPSVAYYNTAFSDEGAPFPSTDDSAVAEGARTVIDVLMKFLGVQVTGGSTTVPDGYEKLRVAGAVARETIKAAAAAKTGVAVGDLKTEGGQVILPDGTTIAYTELAAEAANIDPVQDVELRDPATWRLMGKPMQRHDIAAKSTGTLTYGIDQVVEGMVHASIKLNPAQGGDMVSFDATMAKTMPGVLEVLPVTGGVGVIATNTWYAIEGAKAVEVEWGPSPMPATMEEHWDTVAAAFDGEIDSRNRDDGDVGAALDGADAFEAEYRMPYLAHAPLEPIGAIVRVTNDRADVWTGTQIPRFTQGNVAGMTGLDREQVHIHAQYMGGSFGHRLEDEVVKQATEIALQMKGTPIKLTYSREEDMTHDFTRQISIARMSGAVKNGQIDAVDARVAMPSVLSSQMSRQGLSVPGPDVVIVTGMWEQPYAIPHHRVTGYRAADLAPLSSWRSVGASTNAFAYDCFLDELAHQAGVDPLEERIRLCNHDASRQALETVGEMSGWGRELPEGTGLGVGFSLSFGASVAEVVQVTNTDRGIRIDNVWVAAEVGRVIDPINFDNLVKGGVIWGLGHAINCEITYVDGIAEQSNFDWYQGMRMYQTPQIEVRGLENGSKIRGIGEPPVPPAAPALANAIFAATGQRIREMPFNKFIDFV